jgi:hypothetical protein
MVRDENKGLKENRAHDSPLCNGESLKSNEETEGRKRRSVHWKIIPQHCRE